MLFGNHWQEGKGLSSILIFAEVIRGFKGRMREQGELDSLESDKWKITKHLSVSLWLDQQCLLAGNFQVRILPSHRDWETETLFLMITFQRNGSQALRRTLLSCRGTDSQLWVFSLSKTDQQPNIRCWLDQTVNSPGSHCTSSIRHFNGVWWGPRSS